MVDGEYYINEVLKVGKKIFVEGVQGFMLDIDYGIYFFVIFFNIIFVGVCIGLGVVFS